MFIKKKNTLINLNLSDVIFVPYNDLTRYRFYKGLSFVVPLSASQEKQRISCDRKVIARFARLAYVRLDDSGRTV